MKTKYSTAILLSLATALLGCKSAEIPVRPGYELSEGHIALAETSAHETQIPEATGLTLEPPPVQEDEDLFTNVVTEVSARKILFSLARDAGRNIDVHPGISGNVTLNAIDQTLTQILDRLEKQLEIRYRMEGDLISVLPDLRYFNHYNINYLNISRISKSEVSIATEVSSTGGSAAGDDSSSGEPNVSNTKILNESRNFFWDSLLDNVKAILRGGDSNLEQGSQTAGDSEEAIKDKTSIIANRETGVLAVRGTSKQHSEINSYISNILEKAQRQVIIEATVAEVILNDHYQAGVDWSRLAEPGGSGHGFSFDQALTAGNLATTPFFELSYNNLSGTDWNAAVKMLDQFGDTRVLSSPKLMVLNNQTALLKVVENKVYFTTEIQREEGEGLDGDDITVETTIHTVPVGFVMSVTPQVSEDDFVTINARPTISTITGFAEDPGPAVAFALSNSDNELQIQNLVPEIQVREIESMLKIASGKVGVIGGLMQDTIDNRSDGVPGLSRIPLLGNLFKYRSDQRVKTELVIFIRPVVVKNADVADGDLANYSEYLSFNGVK